MHDGTLAELAATPCCLDKPTQVCACWEATAPVHPWHDHPHLAHTHHASKGVCATVHVRRVPHRELRWPHWGTLVLPLTAWCMHLLPLLHLRAHTVRTDGLQVSLFRCHRPPAYRRNGAAAAASAP